MSKQQAKTVEYVDLDRFMGAWYVIANIPTAIESGAHNAIESYRLTADGTIETEFTFRKNSFDGPEKRYTPTGRVRNEVTNAEWSMQFVWPFKAEYLVIYVNEDYTHTVIGRSKLDYVWIMSREPSIPNVEFDKMISLVESYGYNPAKIQKVPQQWD